VVYATDPIGATYAVDAGAIDGSTVAGSGFGSVSLPVLTSPTSLASGFGSAGYGSESLYRASGS
jgi:hypothetical protein